MILLTSISIQGKNYVQFFSYFNGDVLGMACCGRQPRTTNLEGLLSGSSSRPRDHAEKDQRSMWRANSTETNTTKSVKGTLAGCEEDNEEKEKEVQGERGG